MLLDNARCVNPRVADEVGAPDLVNRIVNLLPLSKKDVVKDELATVGSVCVWVSTVGLDNRSRPQEPG